MSEVETLFNGNTLLTTGGWAGVTLQTEQLDHEPCDMCVSCKKEFEGNPSNPFDILLIFNLPSGEQGSVIDMHEVEQLVKNKRFHAGETDTSTVESTYRLNIDCSNDGCQVGFTMGLMIDVEHNRVRWFT